MFVSMAMRLTAGQHFQSLSLACSAKHITTAKSPPVPVKCSNTHRTAAMLIFSLS